jgi:hypothetical protein
MCATSRIDPSRIFSGAVGRCFSRKTVLIALGLLM